MWLSASYKVDATHHWRPNRRHFASFRKDAWCQYLKESAIVQRVADRRWDRFYGPYVALWFLWTIFFSSSLSCSFGLLDSLAKKIAHQWFQYVGEFVRQISRLWFKSQECDIPAMSEYEIRNHQRVQKSCVFLKSPLPCQQVFGFLLSGEWIMPRVPSQNDSRAEMALLCGRICYPWI